MAEDCNFIPNFETLIYLAAFVLHAELYLGIHFFPRGKMKLRPFDLQIWVDCIWSGGELNFTRRTLNV